ncbi:DNA cytosine methyltransferase [Candidatus Magnetominusculus xianensis]|uniref:Cytosine-specific methyltransferase n=1 Tax=Candidatus Magnetominusculus xianensis TaxID=1748249 RepID=A0ABR5SC34_9BACT|nr:DNA cytosine methyltransferase [Candidatus Magnetominusculus xianensis]KWT78344.1 restriction endonuclease subunit M [Candidatus Magnetominusculus xianensis]MBF0402882.1 DNA cytosine methyltransferase [Nitrospirota bacterium]
MIKGKELTSLELCAGGGGQAIGIERAGFVHKGLVEIDHHCCNTLRLNRPNWQVFEQDIETFDGTPFEGIDLLAGGLPCPPFSKAGKQLGTSDERNLFPAAIRMIDKIRPRAIMIENVRGILDSVFEDYRLCISGQISKLGYKTDWKLLNASDFGVPQLRLRVVFVAILNQYADFFEWPMLYKQRPLSVGETLYDLMASKSWRGASLWRDKASEIAPTIVGGSKKHGGPDLGPTRARKAWAALGVDGLGIADNPPDIDFVGMPRLTLPMVARIQGFPDNWIFSGKKTQAYRQVGNAFPPPVACAVAAQIYNCLSVPQAIRLQA